MYICEPCAQAHHLETRLPTTANGLCEVCEHRRNLAWTDDLFRTFEGEGLPSVAEQLKARRPLESGKREDKTP